MKHTVLIVDDSLTSSRQLTRLIEGLDSCTVTGHASNGAEALRLYETLHPDLVLMDILMPTMDGLESLRTIMKRDPSACVVMVTSLGGVASKVEEALKLGARHVITKPFDPDNVRAIVTNVFSSR
jgi:two-component system, chemotaxis family, chemotaxis protein CheY